MGEYVYYWLQGIETDEVWTTGQSSSAGAQRLLECQEGWIRGENSLFQWLLMIRCADEAHWFRSLCTALGSSAWQPAEQKRSSHIQCFIVCWLHDWTHDWYLKWIGMAPITWNGMTLVFVAFDCSQVLGNGSDWDSRLQAELHCDRLQFSTCIL